MLTQQQRMQEKNSTRSPQSKGADMRAMCQFYTGVMRDGRRLLIEVCHIERSSGVIEVQGIWRATLQ